MKESLVIEAEKGLLFETIKLAKEEELSLSLVVEVDRGLLLEAITLAKKEALSLSEYLANLIDKHVKSEKGELDCPSQGICLVALSKYAELKQTLEGLEKQMIIRALAHTDYIQTDAARLLGIGKSGLNQKINKYNLKVPKIKAAVPALTKALKDEDQGVRRQAAWPLEHIGSASVPALIEALKDKDRGARVYAAVALENIGSEAKAAVPALIEALKDVNKKLRFWAAKALARIGPEAVPALIEALKGQDEWVRRQAAQALAKINTPEAQKALEEYNKQKSGYRPDSCENAR